MIKIISPSSKDNHVASKGTNNRTSSSIPKQKNNVKSSQVTEKFPLDKIGILENFTMIENHPQVSERIEWLDKNFSNLFKGNIPVFEEKNLMQDRITLMTLVEQPSRVLVLYTELCQKEKPLLDRMGALILRLQRLQIKIFTIYLLLDNQPSHVLVAKQHEIFGMLNTITFLRLPSMQWSVRVLISTSLSANCFSKFSVCLLILRKCASLLVSEHIMAFISCTFLR